MTGYLSSSTFFLRWKFIYICVTLSLFFFGIVRLETNICQCMVEKLSHFDLTPFLSNITTGTFHWSAIESVHFIDLCTEERGFRGDGFCFALVAKEGRDVDRWISCAVVMNSLRHLSKTTDILTDPSRLPDEAVRAACGAPADGPPSSSVI